MKWLIIAGGTLLGLGLIGTAVHYEWLSLSIAISIAILALCAGGGWLMWKRSKKAGVGGRTKNPESYRWLDLTRVGVVIGLVLLGLAADPVVRWLFLGLFAFLFTALWVLPYFPGLVQVLSNDPNEFRPEVETTSDMSRVEKAKLEASVGNYQPSTYALFTFIKPGRIKAIIRGERFQRFIMKFDGMTFSGEQQFEVDKKTREIVSYIDDEKRAERNQREYWDVQKNKTGKIDNDSHPIPDSLRKGRLDLTWYWSRHVYDLTGAVFTGIPPFQTVEVYELEQLVKVISSEVDEQGDFVFISRKDYSDHVRAAEFQFFVQVPGAETKDQVKVRLQFALTIMVTNPYRAFYDTDNRWSSRLFTAVVQEVSSRVRGLEYRQVIAADNADDPEIRNQLLEPIRSLNNKTKGRKGARDAKHGLGEIGLFIKDAELVNADVADDKLAAALADVARAQADKEARIKRADAETYAVDNIAAAAQRHGEYGRLALAVEGNVRTAAAATKDGGDVILNIDGTKGEQVDPRTAFLRKSISGGSE